MELLIFYRLLLSAVTATFGTAFAKWFFTTKIGVWVQQKFEQFMNYLQEKYDIELAKKEAAWRLPANCDLETARGIVVSNMVFSETKGRPAR